MLLRAVWPDGGLKSRPILSKNCPKMTHSRFYLKRAVFNVYQIAFIWAIFVTEFYVFKLLNIHFDEET